MKGNRNARSAHRDDEAVSTVLGAILVAALVVMVLVMIRINFVPQWDEQTDAEHVGELEDQMAVLRAALDQQLETPSPTQITVPFDLTSAGRAGMFASPTLPSSLEFQGSVDGVVQLSADEILVRQETNTQLEAVNEQWSSVLSNGTITDVLDVSHLRLRLTDPESGDHGDGITLTIKDVNDQFAGSLRYYVEHVASSYFVNAEVKNAAGTTIFDGGEAAHHQVAPPYVWLDALDESVFFDQVIAAASEPLSLELAQTGLTGHYAITYEQDTPGGPVTVGNSGLLIEDYTTSLPAGPLQVSWNPAQLPAQTLVLEHGAVFRVQDDGAGIVIPPAVTFTNSTGGTGFTLGLPLMTGSGDSRTGGSVPVGIAVDSSINLDGQANNFTITLQTGFPTLWRQAYENAASRGDVPSEYYTITNDAQSITMHIEGTSSDPAVYDVSINIRQASITTTLPR